VDECEDDAGVDAVFGCGFHGRSGYLADVEAEVVGLGFGCLAEHDRADVDGEILGGLLAAAAGVGE
jgi:hypothetical protein